MNWLGQHWYTYIFIIFSISCLITAGKRADRDNTANVIWYLFVTCAWASLAYWNWSI
jgi:hypothetical protein